MNQRKPGISVDRHRELGLELARISDQLTHIFTEIMNAYPKGQARTVTLKVVVTDSGGQTAEAHTGERVGRGDTG